MITFDGNPDNGSGNPIGYGPRLWVKFEDADVRSQVFRDLVAHFKTICCWGGPDRLLLSDEPESNARIMSWEFPGVRDQNKGEDHSDNYSCRWKAAIAYLAKIGAKRTEDENFMKGFSQLYG